MTESLKRQLKKTCESDKKSHADKLEAKHEQVIQQIRDDTVEQNAKDVQKLVNEMTTKCNTEK